MTPPPPRRITCRTGTAGRYSQFWLGGGGDIHRFQKAIEATHTHQTDSSTTLTRDQLFLPPPPVCVWCGCGVCVCGVYSCTGPPCLPCRTGPAGIEQIRFSGRHGSTAGHTPHTHRGGGLEKQLNFCECGAAQCCQVAEIPAKKLKRGHRKKKFVAEFWLILPKQAEKGPQKIFKISSLFLAGGRTF